MDLQFSGEVWFWSGPAPHHARSVPEELGGGIEVASSLVTYGWGMIPVARARHWPVAAGSHRAKERVTARYALRSQRILRGNRRRTPRMPWAVAAHPESGAQVVAGAAA